jgi:hypothetical protein
MSTSCSLSHCGNLVPEESFLYGTVPTWGRERSHTVKNHFSFPSNMEFQFCGPHRSFRLIPKSQVFHQGVPVCGKLLAELSLGTSCSATLLTSLLYIFSREACVRYLLDLAWAMLEVLQGLRHLISVYLSRHSTPVVPLHQPRQMA